MNEKVLKFMEKEIPKRNITIFLQKIKDELLELHNCGYTMNQINDYIRINYKIKTSRQTVSNLIKGEINDTK